MTESEQKNDKKTSLWPWWLGLVFIIFTYYASQFFSGALLLIYGGLIGKTEAQTSDWLTNSIYPQFFFILITEAVVVTAIYLFIRQYKDGFKAIGIRKPRWSDVGWAALIAPAYLLTYLIVVAIVSGLVPGFDINQEQDIGFDHVAGSLQLFITFVSLVILPPLAEELMARGVIYSSFKRAMPIFWSAIFTSVIFALPHLQGGQSGTLLYVAGVDTFILSMYLIYLREKTGGLWASMTLHALKNCVAFVALFVIGTR